MAQGMEIQPLCKPHREITVLIFRSMTIRTACSSSLIGLNEACMAIAKGDCTSAIIGGTSILLAPSLTAVVSEQAALGADGSCKTFSSAADGYVRGEAIVAIYVKSLAEALRDGNPIRAVVVGSATNSDGKTPGFSAPSMTAQEALIRHTYKVAGISESEMAKTGFFECHGTGTSLGDPTEAGAVARVFGDEGIHIGSIKPNLGHSEGASGLTAVLKAVLALEHRVIPPNIKALPLNPKIPFESAHLTVPIDSTPWPADRYERVSVNSFGVGGSNAHVIIDSAASFNVSTISRYEKDEPVKAKTATLRGTPHLLVYSASSRESLAALTARYEAFMHEHADTLEHILLDLAYTLANRREHLLHRAFAVATADRIGVASLPSAPRVAGQAQAPSVVMVFTGQGAQWPQMGRELVKTNTVFKDTIRSLDQHLQACHASTWTIEEELLKPAKTSRVNEAEFSQPLCTALQIALVDSLKSVGIQPAAVVGHSSGEIAAAYAAGGLTREEAMSVAFCRGTATKQQIRVGAMAAIGLGWDETTKFLVPGVLMACDNSPKSVTLSGDAELLVNVVENIKNAKPGVLVSMLKVDKAYHSHHMVEVGDAYYAAMTDAGVVGRATSIPFFSSVTGQLLAPEADDALDPKYWQANLESPVRFNTAVSSLLQGPDAIRNPVLLEISAHPALAGPLRQIVTHTASTTVQVISTLTRRQNDIEGFLTAVGKLYTQNVVVDLSAIMPTGICLPSLPSMPWHHPRRYWYETRVSKEWRLRAHPYHDLLGIQVLESTALNPVWRNLFHLDNAPWVRDHKIDNEVVFPFAGYIAMAAEAILQVTGIRDGVSLQHVAVSTALVMSEEKPTELITTLHRRRLTDKQDSSWWEFTITSHNGHSWTKHCVGEVRAEESSVQPSLQRLGFSTTDQSVLPRKLSMRKWYSYLRSHGQGIDFGPHFTTLENARSSTTGRRDGTATMKNNVHGDDANYHLHPAIVDGFLQLLGFASRYGLTHDYPLVVPTSVERMTIFRCTDEHIDLAVSADVLGERVLGEGSCVANSQTIMSVSGVSMAALDPLDDYGEIESGILPTTAQCEWVRHPDFVDINALIELFPDYRRQHDSAPALDELAQLAIALSQQSARSLERSTCSHLKKYQAWLDQQDSMSLGSMDRTTLQAQISSLVDLLASSPIAPAAIAISKVCMHAGQILSGEMEPWEIMSADDILKLDAIMKSYDTSSFLRCLGQSKPNLRVLELGAGSSTATEGILKDLTRVDGQALYSQYVCVNVSYGIVEIIKTSLSKAHPKVEFVQCDIADELALESFEGRQFDLIIASGVIYTTSSIQRSFKNVRELLSPSGRLLLHEPLPGQQWTKYVSGILPSWWCGSEDGRYDEPYLSPERWEEELIAAGFGSVDVVLPDPSDNVFRLSTMMVAKPKRSQEAAIKKKVTLLYSAESIPSGPFAKELEAQGYDIHRCTIGEALPLGQDVISLLDAEKPFFDGIDSAGFEQFQKLVENLNVNRSGLLWVTQSSQAQHPDPRYALIHGLSRSIRSEMAIDFATCEVDDFASSTAARALVDIFTKYSERQDDGLLGPDYEYAISSGMTFVNRLFPVSFRKESLVSEPSDKSILQMSQ
jgi:acyl transferase domain-containing protein/SAM-dependent methyltransferase